MACAILQLTTTDAAAAVVANLKPGDDIQAVVDAHPAGTVYVFEPGTYRLQTILPKTGDVFDGKGQAVLNGSKLLNEFQRSGELWIVPGQTPTHGRLKNPLCKDGFPRCGRPEDVYLDDKPLQHVDSVDKVGPGKWYFDYVAAKVYLGDDPTGHKVEIGATLLAFGGRASNVTIQNLTVEKYAASFSAIDAEYGKGWVVKNNLVRLNHSVAVNAGNNSRILGNRLLENGQQGFEGSGTNYVIEGNEIADNNYSGVSFEWEAGGGKVTETEDAIIRGNCVHDNDGPGIWADEGVRNLVIEDNVVFNNSANGIMYEISYDGMIRNNTVADNGKAAFQWFWGPQILISGSSGVEVYGNTVDVPANYGNAIMIVAQDRSPYPPASGNRIFDNTIVMRGNLAKSGVGTDVPAYVDRVAETNSMNKNRYHVADLATVSWHWRNKDLGWNGIKAEGQEAEGTIDTILPPKPLLGCAFLNVE